MNIKIGIDVVDVENFETLLEQGKTWRRYFTARELDYCLQKTNPAIHLAVRFAAKEAVLKAYAGFGRKLRINDVEIVLNSLGRPEVAHLRSSLPNLLIDLSLSHTKHTAVAVAIITKYNEVQ